MIDDVSDILELYSNSAQQEHSRLERHQLEYELTWRYLNQYLPSQGNILEVGAATGRYTLELAKRGFTITAVDLSATLIGESRQNVLNEGLERQVRFVVADARNLREVTEKRFDAVLLMGPLYHLVEKADRKLALKEAFDRLRKGGVLFSSFISRFGTLSDLIKNVPDWIEDQPKAWSLIQKGRRPHGYPRGGFRGYFVRPSEIAPLHRSVGFETLVVAGVEPVIGADDESYNQLQEKQRQLWLDLLFALSVEKSIIGASRHLLYIGKKK
jgi:S-adenosylmethionine-dependent methyltransferase